MLKAVIFDFDGVVVNSEPLHLNAWDQACRSVMGIPLANPRQYIGLSTSTIAHLIAQGLHKPELATLLARQKKQILSESGELPELLPGSRECFATLTERRIPFGIASNAPKTFINSTLNALALKVPVVVGVEDVLRPKPAPDVFVLCAAKLGFAHKSHYAEILVFEDSTHGLQAAVSVGMRAIGITTSTANDALNNALLAAGAQAICAYPYEYLSTHT